MIRSAGCCGIRQLTCFGEYRGGGRYDFAMNVRVVLFAKPRELVGRPNVDLALPAGATAAAAWSQLSTRYALGPLPRSFRCAVHSESAGCADALDGCDELAGPSPETGA